MNQKTKNKINFRLTSGWKAFVKDNNLKVGNVCTFELIDGTKLTFLVHIFRETDSSNCSTSQGRIDVCFSIPTIPYMSGKYIHLSSVESGQMRAACQSQRKELKTITATK